MCFNSFYFYHIRGSISTVSTENEQRICRGGFREFKPKGNIP